MWPTVHVSRIGINPTQARHRFRFCLWPNPTPLTLHARFWREHFRSEDWAFDDVAIDQLANIILAGEESPDYRVNVVSVAARYRF